MHYQRAEEAGFDLSTTTAASEELTAWCARVFTPSVSLLDLRAGLRPKPRHGRPVIEPLDGAGSLLVATGHFKNGVLMAPLTGQVVVRGILEGSPGQDMSPFAIDR